MTTILKNIGLLFVLIISTALVYANGMPPFPELYAGNAYVNDVLVSDGTSITIEVQGTGEIVGSTTSVTASSDYNYLLEVFFDDDNTTNDEGADLGDILVWKINGIITSVPLPGVDTANPEGENYLYDIRAIVNFIIGNSSNINSSLDLTVEIDGTPNLDHYEGGATVIIKEDNQTLVEFYFNFSDETKLDFRNIGYEKNINNDSGSVIISGITLPEGETKTLYVDNINNLTTLCIKDAEITSITQISSLCNGVDEYGISCPGTANSDKYNCAFTDNTSSIFKITGLDYSGVQQQSYCGDGIINGGEDCSTCPTDYGSCPSSAPSSSSGGGGGGGGGGGAFYICNQDWNCTKWSACDGIWKTRECDFVKVPQHSSKEMCPSKDKVPSMAEKCGVIQKEKEIEKEVTEETTEETEEQEGGLGAITGGVIGVPEKQSNPIVGIIILIFVVVLGLILYYQSFKKRTVAGMEK